jgi:hypothetical protein
MRRFGLDTLKVIEEDPRRLREVLGVGPKRAGLIERAVASIHRQVTKPTEPNTTNTMRTGSMVLFLSVHLRIDVD